MTDEPRHGGDGRAARHRRQPAIIALRPSSLEGFDRWMDRQLDLLIERWVHAASPQARLAHRIGGRRSPVR